MKLTLSKKLQDELTAVLVKNKEQGLEQIKPLKEQDEAKYNQAKAEIEKQKEEDLVVSLIKNFLGQRKAQELKQKADADLKESIREYQQGL